MSGRTAAMGGVLQDIREATTPADASARGPGLATASVNRRRQSRGARERAREDYRRRNGRDASDAELAAGLASCRTGREASCRGLGGGGGGGALNAELSSTDNLTEIRAHRESQRETFRQQVYGNMVTLRRKQMNTREKMMKLMWQYYHDVARLGPAGSKDLRSRYAGLMGDLYRLETSLTREQDAFRELERRFRDEESARRGRDELPAEEDPANFLADRGKRGWDRRYNPAPRPVEESHRKLLADIREVVHDAQEKGTVAAAKDRTEALVDTQRKVRDKIREVVARQTEGAMSRIFERLEGGGGAVWVPVRLGDGRVWFVDEARRPGARTRPLQSQLPGRVRTVLSPATIGRLLELMGEGAAAPRDGKGDRGGAHGASDAPAAGGDPLDGGGAAWVAREIVGDGDPRCVDDRVVRSLLTPRQYMQLHLHGMVSPLSLTRAQLDAVADLGRGWDGDRGGVLEGLGAAMHRRPADVLFGTPD
jgi:hypothetical protein